MVPIDQTIFTWLMVSGSRSMALAMFVAGPRVTISISSGYARTVRKMKSIASSFSAFRVGLTRPLSPMPSVPKTLVDFHFVLPTALSVPLYTGASQPPISSAIRALRAAWSKLTLSDSTVTPSIWTSGQVVARMRAEASSAAVSVSMINRRVAAASFAGEDAIAVVAAGAGADDEVGASVPPHAASPKANTSAAYKRDCTTSRQGRLLVFDTSCLL